MSDKLIFFNKEGDYLNANYNSITNRYEADLIFHENSSDTFKTIGIYTFEKKDGFSFESDNLELDKFQLFNEYGFSFSGSKYVNEFIEKIETSNYDSNFYSKWIYGNEFDTKFPIGSKISFDVPYAEFGNSGIVYNVLSTKRGAILILSNMDNLSFYNNYGELIEDSMSYIGVSISGRNIIGVKNYSNNLSSNNIASWSESKFIDKLKLGKKINVVGGINEGVYTISDMSVSDSIYQKYYIEANDVHSTVTTTVKMKNNTPVIYNGVINIDSSGKVGFGSDVPNILKSGYKIRFTSNTNIDVYTISNIQSFNDAVGTSREFTIGYQVMYNGDIYECLETFNYILGNEYDTPDESEYWTNVPTHIYIDGDVQEEMILDCDVYLVNDVYTFTQEYINSPEDTMGLFDEVYKQEMLDLGIKLDFNQLTKELSFELISPSKYLEIEVKSGNNIITKEITINEKNICVYEPLNTYSDNNISELYNREIVFDSISDFGFKLYINGMLYDQECVEVYTNGVVNKQRTIDKTLRAFVKKYFARLLVLGIEIKLKNIKDNSIYFNTIVINTTYPNVPIDLDVEVGDSGFYYIRHSSVTINNIEQVLSININGRTYDQQRVLFGDVVDVEETLIEWMDAHYLTLYSFGIFVYRTNNTLYFNMLNASTDFEYQTRISRTLLYNDNDVLIRDYKRGNIGTIITSNSIQLLDGSEESFLQDDLFSTGMIVTINNTLYPYNNQQYNILYVNDNEINLSYQGPFWGKTEEVCVNSPFQISAFSDGFESSLCEYVEPNPEPGEFVANEFTNEFTIVSVNNQDISTDSINLASQYGNLKDIIYVNSTEALYVLADNLLLLDSNNEVLLQIDINSGFDKMEMDSVNNYLVLFSDDTILCIDVNTNVIAETHILSPGIAKVVVDGGYIFVSHLNSNVITKIVGGNISYYNMTSEVANMVSKPTTQELYILLSDSIIIAKWSNLHTNITHQTTTLQGYILYEPNIDRVIAFDTQFVCEVTNDGIEQKPKFVGGISSVYFDDVHNLITYIDDNIFYAIEPYTYAVKYSFDVNSSYNIISSPYDGNYYLYSQNGANYLVLNPISGEIILSGSYIPQINNIIFNPSNNKMIGVTNTDIVFVFNSVVETSITLPNSFNVDGYGFGTLHNSYVEPSSVWLKVSDYVRYPRENQIGEHVVEYVWKWENDNVDEIFMFDFSGNHLVTQGPYAYVGEKPLRDIVLNRLPNKDLSKTSLSQYQQTIFNEIGYKLEYINSNNINYLPTPMEIFIGFNSNDEGVVSNKLNLIKRENISFKFDSDLDGNFIIIENVERDGVNVGKLSIPNYSNRSFINNNGTNTGLKVGQKVKLNITDLTNKTNNYASKNNGLSFRIISIDNKSIYLEYLESELVDEGSIVFHNNVNTCLSISLRVLDDVLATFNIKGQTEIEDIRYKIELGNQGKLINSEDIYIFKEYDINEKGIDWAYMNKKRKEMLMVKHDIFSYVGSYKAIINAINYFGYNDLELYEYYRNINIISDEYGRLSKVEIPDIFNNSIKGWDEKDFISQAYNNDNYELTNLFNLTYRITDKDGNNIQMYSIDEVLIKLQGLKRWLQKNVVPITHELLDITGRSDVGQQTSVIHRNYDSRNTVIRQTMAPVNVNISEAYLMPINSGSTVYNLKIDFDTKDKVEEVFYDIKIKTYKTYNEWEPFNYYAKGERVSYYQQIYESNVDSNRTNDPRKYSDINSFNILTNYEPFQRVFNKGRIYQWLGTLGSLISHMDGDTPIFQSVENTPIPGYDIKWKDVTEWIPIDYEPVQYIQEYKNTLDSTTLTVDTNIDPFIVIEVQSDNGYGLVWTTKKNYELRSTTDMSNAVTVLEAEPLPTRLPDPDPDLPLNEIPVISCEINNQGFAIEDMEPCILVLPGGVNGFAEETVYNCELLPSNGSAIETIYNCSLLPDGGTAIETLGGCSISDPVGGSIVPTTLNEIGIRYPQLVYGFKAYEGGDGMCRLTPSPVGPYVFGNYPTMLIYTDKPSLLESTKIYFSRNSPTSNMNSIISAMDNTIGYYDDSANSIDYAGIPPTDWVFDEYRDNPANQNPGQHHTQPGLVIDGNGPGGTITWADRAKIWITCHDTRVAVAIDSSGNITHRNRCQSII